MQKVACHGTARTPQGHIRPCPLSDECLKKVRETWPTVTKEDIFNPGPYDFEDAECGQFEVK